MEQFATSLDPGMVLSGIDPQDLVTRAGIEPATL
jgi:hypothetical protein